MISQVLEFVKGFFIEFNINFEKINFSIDFPYLRLDPSKVEARPEAGTTLAWVHSGETTRL
jgi:hypothetical protein